MIEKARGSWMNIFIQNSKIAYLIVVFIVVWGAMSAYEIPKESAPAIDFGIVQVSTVYNGASAFDMDQLVTQEIENKVKDVDGISTIRSGSRRGFSRLTIELDPQTDTASALNDIRSKVDEAKSKLPSEAEDPSIQTVSSNREPLFDIQLVGDIHPALLRDYAEQLKTHLESDPQILEAEITGGAEREIFVDLDPAQLKQYGLSVDEVIAVIGQSHRDNPVGELTIDSLEYSLRFEGRHRTAEDVRDIIIRVQSGSTASSAVSVGDIATVYESDEETGYHLRYVGTTNGREVKSTAKLHVIKVENTDIFKADPRIRQMTLDFVAEHFDAAIEVGFTSEALENVRDSYDTVLKSGVQSIIMVILLLILFIRVKESLIASLVIPLSFLITIAVTSAMGSTLNFMVNFSMILALGILVDVSIVIIEGIHDGIKKGYEPKEAAELALYEFKTPLISGMLTTLAVFIPLLVLPGIMGKYLSHIPISVSITLTASLAVSLLLVPGIAASILRSEAEEKKRQKNRFELAMIRFYTWRDGWLDALTAWYESFIGWALARRWYRIGVFYVILALFAGSFLLPVKFTLFPAGDMPIISVTVELPKGMVKEETLAAVLPVEAIILQNDEVKVVQTTIQNNSADILVELYKNEVREQAGQRTSMDLSKDLRKEFQIFQNYDVRLREAQGGPPSAAPVSFRVIAADPDRFYQSIEVARDFKHILESLPGTANVRDDIDNIPGEMTYRIDREAALRLGVQPSSISTAMRAAIDGVTAATITRGGREVDIRVRYIEDAVTDFSDVENIQIPNARGDTISLSQVVSSEFRSAFSEIKRVDRQIAVTLLSDLAATGNAAEITAAFQEAIADYELPAGVTVLDAGENAENEELFMAFTFGFVIAILLIFSILVIQFNSFGLPAIILFTILMSLLGVNFGLFVTGTMRSMAFIIGIISLSGIVVNDAIILVDRINKLRHGYEDERKLEHIIAHAGGSRLIPIMLTTLTTTAGIGPLIWVDEFWAGLSVTVIFGLIVASTLTLFVTPAMYTQISCEGKVTFAPLGILAGAGMLIAGLVMLNFVLIGLGLVIGAIFAWMFWKGYKIIREHGESEIMST